MFHGDDELNFTPEEAELVARAEGRRAPGSRRRFAARRTPHPQPGGAGALFGILIAGLLLVGLAGSTGPAVQRETPRPPVPLSAGPQPRHAPQPTQGERPWQSVTANAGAGLSQPPDPSPAKSAPPAELLPPGWERTAFTRDAVLFANAWLGARVVGPIQAGTELLIRIVPAGGSCSNDAPQPGMSAYLWHAAALSSGTGWGYVCVAFPESLDTNIRRPLPPGWLRRVYQGNGQALLQYPNGQILPGAEVLMRARGNNPDEFFVLSADGQSWGFGRFQIGVPIAEEPPALVHERIIERWTELPPAWERVVLHEETTLHENANRATPVRGVLPAGTVVLIKHVFDCWYGAVTEDGEEWGLMWIAMPPHEPARMAFGLWTYERFPRGRSALIRRLPGGLVLYILADGSGWGKTSSGAL